MKRRPSGWLEPITAPAEGHAAGRLWVTVGLKLGAAYGDAAKSLIEMVVGEYVRLHDAAPRELFIHAKYTPSRLSLTRNGWGLAPAAAKARISWASKIAEARDDLKLFRPRDLPMRWRRSHLSTDGQRAEVAFQVYIGG
jgi:hypothetical protein